MKSCIICGQPVSRPFAAAVFHFRPIDWEQRQFIRGNFKAFGFVSGLRANLTLLFPFLNTVLNWKHRKSHLEFADGSELEAMCEIERQAGATAPPKLESWVQAPQTQGQICLVCGKTGCKCGAPPKEG